MKKLTITATLILGITIFIAYSAKAELVAYWSLDEGQGEEVIDNTGNGYDGNFVGDPQWIDGKYGKALEFDGDDHADVPGLADVNPESITMSAWVYFYRTAGYRQDFLSRGDDYAFTLGGHEQDERFHAVITTGGDWIDMIGDTVTQAEQWYHVAMTYCADTKMLTLYVDGEVDAEKDGPMGMEHRLGGSFTIGTYNDRYLEGILDEIKIWDEALSIDEIKQAMNPASVEPDYKLVDTWGNIKSSE